MDFLRKYSLPIGLKKAVKNHPYGGQSLRFEESKKVLLFFTSQGNQKIVLVKALQNKLEREGKEVTCLYLVEKDEDKPDVHLDEGMERITVLDFSYFGKIEKLQVLEILKAHYDFVLHLDMESNIHCDLVLASCKARCRIGRYFENHEELYEMMVKVDNDKKINYLIDQIYHYTKEL